jgi:DNA-binding transcriptional MerR regulator
MLVNREKLAELLGCSLRTIDEYKRQGMPGEAPKRPGDQWKFDTAASVEWLRQRERQSALGEIATIDESEAKRRKLAAEAAMAELDLAKAEEMAVAVQDFSKAWAGMIGSARAKLLGLGSKLGPGLAIIEDAAECSSAVDAGIGEALQELSEFEPEIRFDAESDQQAPGGDAPGPKALGAAPGSHGKRVGGRGEKAIQRIKR